MTLTVKMMLQKLELQKFCRAKHHIDGSKNKALNYPKGTIFNANILLRLKRGEEEDP